MVRAAVVPGEDCEPEPMGAELVEHVGEFLSAWASIEKHTLAGWLALQPAGFTPDELLEESLAVFNAELQRLEFEQDVARAIEDAKERDRDRK